VAIPAGVTIEREAEQTYLGDLMEGLRFLRHDRLLLVIIATVMVTNFLDAAKSSVIYPVYASEIYNSSVALGLMFGLSGGGAVIGAIIYGWIGHRYSRRLIFIFSFMAVSLPIFVLALFPPLYVVLLVQLFNGIAAGPINPVLSTVEYERIPVHMRGRVFGAITAGAWMAMPLGVLLAGYALEWVGLAPTLLVTGALYLLTTGSLLFNPVLHEMERKPAMATR
jgi:MFS family permease